MFSRGIRVLAARLRGLLDRRRAEAEAAEELEAHIALHIAENLRAGMSPAEARRQALVQLGGMEAPRKPAGISGAGPGWRRWPATCGRPRGRFGGIPATRRWW
ncbi:MAG: permease prefix domain 1-containing protein [Terriglobales bacterium]